MNRRSFLKLASVAAAGAAVAPMVSKVSRPDVHVASNPSLDYGSMPRGVPFFVEDSGGYFGVSRSAYWLQINYKGQPVEYGYIAPLPRS